MSEDRYEWNEPNKFFDLDPERFEIENPGDAYKSFIRNYFFNIIGCYRLEYSKDGLLALTGDELAVAKKLILKNLSAKHYWLVEAVADINLREAEIEIWKIFKLRNSVYSTVFAFQALRTFDAITHGNDEIIKYFHFLYYEKNHESLSRFESDLWTYKMFFQFMSPSQALYVFEKCARNQNKSIRWDYIRWSLEFLGELRFVNWTRRSPITGNTYGWDKVNYYAGEEIYSKPEIFFQRLESLKEKLTEALESRTTGSNTPIKTDEA